MTNSPHQAIIVIGAEEPAEATLVEAEQYDEVVVIARAVPDVSGRWVIDGDHASPRPRSPRPRRHRRPERNCSTKGRPRTLPRRGGDPRL